MDTCEREIEVYRTQNGKCPFNDWYDSLKDVVGRTQIWLRLHRLALGNMGDCKPIGFGVQEMRIKHRPGYRIYFGCVDKRVVLLLCGGDKNSQKRDIMRARNFWADYRSSHDEDKNG